MTAFRATYSDWKLVKTRGVVQVVMEVPLAEADAAYGVLGGMPNSANEQWFGIAPIKLPVPAKETAAKPEPLPTARAKRDWRDLQPPTQAGIRCEEPAFEQFLKEERQDDWAEAQSSRDAVCLICGVQSRSELATNQKARVIWHQLDSQFQAWKALEHA
jgi:hypothetical protein